MRPPRVLLVICLLAVLVGLCVGYGSLDPDPDAHRYPGNAAFVAGAVDPGDRVVLSGIVREVTDGGVVLDLKNADATVTLRGLDGDPAVGDDVWLSGVRVDDGRVAVDRALVRAPWEIDYLYGVSLVGGLLTLGGVLMTWRVDRERRLLVPREGRGG
jgi:hypothetical protein